MVVEEAAAPVPAVPAVPAAPAVAVESLTKAIGEVSLSDPEVVGSPSAVVEEKKEEKERSRW